MFKLTNKRRYQLIGFLAILVLVLLFLPRFMMDKSNPSLPTIVKNSANQTEPSETDDFLTHQTNALNESSDNQTPNTTDTDKVSLDAMIQNIEQSNTTPRTQKASTPSQAYYVRLAALSNPDNINEKLTLLTQKKYPVVTRKSNNFTIILIGPYRSESDAKKIQEQSKALGFPDAKIVTESP